MTDVTRILNATEQVDARGTDELLPLVYEELRLLAAQRRSHAPPGQTLQATALVHEALGLSHENSRQRLIQARTRESMEPWGTPVTPRRRRQEARCRLNERSRALASRIVSALGASINGRNIATGYKTLEYALDMLLRASHDDKGGDR